MTVTSTLTERIEEHFQLPIALHEQKVSLKQNIITDLELVSSTDPSVCQPIYHFCFDSNTENPLSVLVSKKISQYYTTDVAFLKDNQTLLKTYTRPPDTPKYTQYANILGMWDELKVKQGFKEKYYYVDWEPIEFLNHSEWFLQFMSMYNLFSPVFSLLVPIFILLIPFLILRLRGMPLTFEEYFVVLKMVAQTNAIGKLFTVNFSEINLQEQIYIFVSAAFYLFSIYQNVMVCVRFHDNMKTIHSHFDAMKEYLGNTLMEMDTYRVYSAKLATHAAFHRHLEHQQSVLLRMKEKLDSIGEYTTALSVKKFKEVGRVFKYFYELHKDEEYESAMMFSLGFHGYLDCLHGLQANLKSKQMSFVTFLEKQKEQRKSILKRSYYACLKDEKPIKNTVRMRKNLIITGPNASGKTTILKSTLINVILSQQFGCGFYAEGSLLYPFKHIHCYLNIPDTSGRDSLFQAEARRCKEILDTIETHNVDSHFCVFDELYSGTNPEEAELSATAFMMYLQKKKRVMSMLTTHFVNVCKKLDKTEGIENHRMVCREEAGKLEYTYCMEKGISEIKGGIHVLSDLNFPKEIIENSMQAVR